MSETLNIDGHVYTQRADGLYEPDEKYVISDDWVVSSEHDGYVLLADVVSGVRYAKLLAKDPANFELLRSMHDYRGGSTYLLDASYCCNDITVGYLEVVQNA